MTDLPVRFPRDPFCRAGSRLMLTLDEAGACFLGLTPDGVQPGRDMLARATALCWRDRRRLRCLKRDVYPESGRPFGRTGAQAERAMRHVIQAAWRTGDMAEQQRLFGDTIDERRGHPTSSEMIAQLSDILRWEGRP